MSLQKKIGDHIRWSPGERLDHLFEARCDALEGEGRAQHPAVIEGGVAYSYGEIDRRANQLARHLIALGIASGDRVGVLLRRSKESYITLLAILKANAAYVPLDAAFPDERIAFILEDAGATAVVSLGCFAERLAALPQRSILIDREQASIAMLPDGHLADGERQAPTDELSYIIYTSGTTGKPKGVAIEHGSICNFVRVAAETYGYRSDDRVFQGMTVAFDFSVEEIWVPLMAGATLVPGPTEASLVGEDLADFLEEQRVTALCCVPTLLATIERELPALRLLLVSGEACPQNLVARWHRPGRTMLNAYGPTEATVTATLTELHPDKPVTIGFPLPSYTVVILDSERDELVAPGGTGEIGIAGICLARGYLNRDDLTAEKFVPDFLGLAGNPSKRIYRTGDLGRINVNGEIEYLGRKDTQVKLRGYRIELTEIESVIMRIPGIAQAVVDAVEVEPGRLDLVAYYSLQRGARGVTAAEILAALREQLPSYMLPAYIEKLPIIPMTSSHKADRKALPRPKGGRVALGGAKAFKAPVTKTEKLLARELAALLSLPRVSVSDDVFKDLGGHSLLMARFCAALRRDANLPDVSMRDVYQNPTIERLAAELDSRVAASAHPAATPAEAPASRHRPSNLAYYGCGTLQFATGLGFGLLALWVLLTGFHWTYAVVDDLPRLYLRILYFVLAVALVWCLLPVAAKWLLIGRWKAECFPVWSLRYFRFWLVKGLMNSSPLVLFGGGPVYNVYLRLLGARIGRNSSIRSGAPVCTDLFSVGDNTLIRNGTAMPGYFAADNMIHIGPIAIGSDAFVGTASVVDIDTAIGNGAQLGHSSCLSRGQRVPDGKRYHGTPAHETETDYCRVEPRRCTALRRWLYSAIFVALGLPFLPLAVIILYYLFPLLYHWSGAPLLDYAAPLRVAGALAMPVAIVSLALFATFTPLGLLSAYAVPRLLNLCLKPGRVYPLFGLHYFLQGWLSAASNAPAFNVLFGDSSYIVNYLRFAGYRLNRVKQTGANFGLDQKHDNPFLCDIGYGTMVSDGLAMANVEMSSTSFRLGRVTIGENSYLGNNILLPAESALGDNVLLATKALVPLDGPRRENVGLLGSPCFEIPRASARDCKAAVVDPAQQRALLRGKNLYNLATMAGYLLAHLLAGSLGLLIVFLALLYYPIYGASALIAGGTSLWLCGTAYWIVVERASIGFRRLKPQVSGLYDRSFLVHERHWKFCATPLVRLYSGTPFKNLISRLLGVRIGRKVFDDGANLYDKTLLEIGDFVNLNTNCVLQGHSLEEGVFKADYVRIGAGSNIGCGAFVHYGVEMGERVSLGANAFLMKGEVVPADAVWHGNPACYMSGTVAKARPRPVAPASRKDAQSQQIIVAAKVAASKRAARSAPPHITLRSADLPLLLGSKRRGGLARCGEPDERQRA